MFFKEKPKTLEVREWQYHRDHFVVTLAINGTIEKFRGSGRHWYFLKQYEYKNRLINHKQIRLFLEKWWSTKITELLPLEPSKPYLEPNIVRTPAPNDTGEYTD